MSITVVVGTVLVLLSWAVLLVLLTGVGLVFAHLTAPSAPIAATMRTGMWWGLAFSTLVVLLVGLAAPLGSASAGWTILAVLIAALLVGVISLRRVRVAFPRRRPISGPAWLLLASLAGMVVYLAFKTIGPATNYDTGLYHLGFIRYLSDFGNVPGLVNLFLPFGYSNAQFPLAAALTSGPWQGEGWRLLNGLLVSALAVELAWRLRERRWSWGTLTLIVGIAAISLPLVAMADSLIASPTSDTAVLVLTLVSAVYLCDVIDDSMRRGFSRSRGSLSLGVLIITTGLTVAMRPTMLAYAGGVGLVLLVLLWRSRRTGTVTTTSWLLPGVWLLLMGAVQIYRDYVLSGWLMYPLSIFRWDVPWVGRDPVALRDATLAAARDPSAADGYVVAHSWEWLGAWFSRLPEQWEPWFLVAGLTALVVVSLWARSVAGFPTRPRLLLLALVPGLVATMAWFLASPPSFRFIWGPLFACLFIPMGAALHAIYRAGRSITLALVAAAVVIFGVTAYSSAFRNLAADYTDLGHLRLGPVSVAYSLAPVPEVETRSYRTVSGLEVREPVNGDQCWGAYPLCTFSMGDRMALQGTSIGDGFVTVR